eukprot:sb/3471468/
MTDANSVSVMVVGKTCMVRQFMSKRLPDEYHPTSFDMDYKPVELDGKIYNVQIYDTAAFQEFSAHKDAFYRSADGFLLVYSVTDQQSFDQLDFLRERILLNRPDGSIILVGNKKDLLDDRVVFERDADEKSQLWGGCQTNECSALYNDNVVPIFRMLVKEIIDKRKLAAKIAKQHKKQRCKVM